MPTQSIGDTKIRFTDIPERCHAADRDAGIPTDDFPTHFRGTLGHFRVHFSEEIARAAALPSVNILSGGNTIEIRHADAHMA